MNKVKKKYLNPSSYRLTSNKKSFLRNKKSIIKLDTNKALLINGYISIKCPYCDEFFSPCIYLDYNLNEESIKCNHYSSEFSLKLDIANCELFNTKINLELSEKNIDKGLK